jgi:peptidyl-prolyl cis-trans isomerase SurA
MLYCQHIWHDTVRAGALVIKNGHKFAVNGYESNIMISALKTLMILTAALFVAVPAVNAQQTMGIAAVVNDEAISMRDVEERLKLIIITSGLPDNKEIRAKAIPQVVESLIEEQLKLQEASRQKQAVSNEEVDEGLNVIAQQNNFTLDQFKEIMKRQGVPEKTLVRQIKSQLAWNKVVKNVLRKQVDVTDRDVDTRIERMKTNFGKTEYLVSEIFLPIDNAKRAGDVQQLASRMAAELQAKKAPFGPVAAQFSKAAGAEKGGSLGWIQQGHLDPALDKILMSMEEGQVSNPIRTPTGIYLLNLQKKRTLTEESIPPRDELTNQIGFERLDRVQQRALLDLKSAAFIDRRV